MFKLVVIVLELSFCCFCLAVGVFERGFVVCWMGGSRSFVVWFGCRCEDGVGIWVFFVVLIFCSCECCWCTLGIVVRSCSFSWSLM